MRTIESLIDALVLAVGAVALAAVFVPATILVLIPTVACVPLYLLLKGLEVI